MSKKSFFTVAILSSILGVTAAALTYRQLYTSAHPKTSEHSWNNHWSSRTRLASNDAPPKSSGGILPDFVPAAHRATHASVHISITREAKRIQNRRSPLEDLIREYFGQELPSPTPQPKTPRFIPAGSGVIVAPEGYIVTNHHVIETADKIEVTLYNNRVYAATLVGSDPEIDIALLKIDAKELPCLTFGNSDEINIGEWVLAIGSPFGAKELTATVTHGIISAKGRSRNGLKAPNEKMGVGSFIQTDATINPGNSGGPLVNLKGEIVGINTALASPNGIFAGYGFAIPSNLVHKAIVDLKTYGVVQKGMLGIVGGDVTVLIEQLAEGRIHEGEVKKIKGAIEQLENIGGVIITDILKGKAAEKTDLKKYDIIVAIDNHPIETMEQMKELIISRYTPGDKVAVHYIRNGKPKTTMLTLGSDNPKMKVVKREDDNGKVEIENAVFQNLDEATKNKLKLQGGVQVAEIKAGKWQPEGGQGGMRKGFIITAINRNPIQNIAALIRVLGTLEESEAVLIEGIYPERPQQRVPYSLYW